MPANQFALLSTRRFLPLFVTQFLGAFNDNAFKNALVILITYRVAELAGMNAQILVTFAAGIFILPFFLFSATAGQLADKYEKSRLVVFVKLAEILLMMGAGAGFYFQNIPMLLLVLFLVGVQAAFFGPVKYAILPELLGEHELIAGNGFIEAGTFLAILLGTITGGLLNLHPAGEYIIIGLIFCIALFGFLSSLLISKTHITHSEMRVNYNFLTETFRVIRYSKQQRDIFLAILGISWFWLVGAVYLAELPVFTKNELHANENVVTYFMALFSIGIGIGSLLCNRLLKGKVNATYVPLGALGISLFTIDIYFAAGHASQVISANYSGLSQFLSTFNGWRITVDLLLVAISGGIYTVPLYALLQQRSNEAHRARVIASNNVINALFMVVAAIATMIMLKMGLSVSQVFLVVAIVNGIMAVYLRKLS